MSAIRRRVKSLEARAAAGPGAGPPLVSGTAAEVREIDRQVRELEAEIAECEARLTPEELEESRREQAERDTDFEARVAGLGLDEQIALLDADIARDEAEECG